jgi:hypothetical protein
MTVTASGPSVIVAEVGWRPPFSQSHVPIPTSEVAELVGLVPMAGGVGCM